MSIDPENFRPQGKPTLAQAAEQYRSIKKPSSQKLCDRLVGLGYSISKATCARYIKDNFQGVKVAAKPKTPLEAVTETAHALIGKEIPKPELDRLEQDLVELRAKELGELKAIFEKERIVTNILLQRFTQRRAESLVLLPRDSAAMVTAMTEAVETLASIPAAKLNGNGHGEIVDITPTAPNPVASAIDGFQRKRLAG